MQLPDLDETPLVHVSDDADQVVADVPPQIHVTENDVKVADGFLSEPRMCHPECFAGLGGVVVCLFDMVMWMVVPQKTVLFMVG